jgi:hypothetical protein
MPIQQFFNYSMEPSFLKVQCFLNHIAGVMVSMLSSSAVDRGIEPRLGRAKDYNIGVLFLYNK